MSHEFYTGVPWELLYADDCVIFSETPQGLQREIDSLFEYCSKWRLKLNTDKSVIVVFRKGNRNVNFNWNFGGVPLTVCNKVRYLGNVLASNASFYQTQRTLAEQAMKSVHLLLRKMRNFHNIRPDLLLDLFDKFITPVLNYGCEIWGFHPAHDIERVHLKFCKNILGVKQSTQNDFVYGELGRLPMQIIRYLRIIKYWLNIVTGKKTLYVSSLYHASLMRIDLDNKLSWARNIKTLLCFHGFGEAWYNQGIADVNLFLKISRERL